MTLQNLLQLDPRLLEPQFMPVLDAGEKLWQQRGRPTGRWELVDLLTALIDQCVLRQIEYPPVLLARKGQLKRGSFVPRHVSRDRATAGNVRADSPAHSSEQREQQSAKPGSCAKCGGRGFVQRNGSASLCGCWGKK